MFTYIFIAAFGGGFIRGLVGFIKHQFSYKNVSFKPGYFIGTMVASGIIGLLSVWAIKEVGFTYPGRSDNNIEALILSSTSPRYAVQDIE